MYGVLSFQNKLREVKSHKLTRIQDRIARLNKIEDNLLKFQSNMLIVKKIEVIDDRYDNPLPSIMTNKKKSKSLEKDDSKNKIRQQIEKNFEEFSEKQKIYPIQKLNIIPKLKKIVNLPKIKKILPLAPLVKISQQTAHENKILALSPKENNKCPTLTQFNKMIKSYDAKSPDKKSKFNYVKEMLRNIMKMRVNWKESLSELTSTFNFKWTPTKKRLEFGLLNQTKIRMVNHFEFETEISNKKLLFLNFLEYCEKNDLNAFDYLPLTIIMKIDGANYKDNLHSFSELHKNIKNFTLSYTNGNLENKSSYHNYADYFKSDVNNYKISSNKMFIPSSHYTGKNLWLIKPTDLYGGKCIQIADNVDDIEKYIKKFYDGIEKKYQGDDEGETESENSDGEAATQKYRSSTVLLQKYIENPLLYYGRKFDIRMWVLIDHKLDVYLFKEGHLKTTSTNYTTDSKDLFVHITNYSLQKHNDNFEKFEKGNEVSFAEFQQSLDTEYKEFNIDIKKHIIPQMILIIKHSALSVKKKINRKDRKFCYVVFGYDFMIDTNFKVWLIEINKNPGLVESSKIIKTLVPRMIDDSFRLTIDLIFNNKSTSSTEDGVYNSPFHVDNYSDGENMFEFLHSLNI